MSIRPVFFLFACIFSLTCIQKAAAEENVTGETSAETAAQETAQEVTPSENADPSAAAREKSTRLKNEAKALRDQAEADYHAAQPVCYERFLVNRCIDEAKQTRLEAIRHARQLESEARKIDLAEKQQAVSERTPSAEISNPSAPSPDAAIGPATEAERIRAERAAAAKQAEAQARAERAAADAERASKRTAAEAEAAGRAEQAARDRARYEERIRQYEEKKARDDSDR